MLGLSCTSHSGALQPAAGTTQQSQLGSSYPARKLTSNQIYGAAMNKELSGDPRGHVQALSELASTMHLLAQFLVGSLLIYAAALTMLCIWLPKRCEIARAHEAANR